ncbi:hypothetical protein AMQ84_19050 [Paenibacillus riograndensis]|uniref:Uncharacterized protein n=1 Tax=Paenibacillus riograndensis TaxID=483937 RepID=A0A132TUL9_9BACL|nr:hypothetical protein AMQ84_19050 [Paenibacillus riograndensis]
MSGKFSCLLQIPGIRHLAFVVEDIEAIVASIHSIFPVKKCPATNRQRDISDKASKTGPKPSGF